MRTKADKFIKQLPELVYPSRMEFDDGSTAEIAGIRFVDWQAAKYIAAMLANPLIVDSTNMDSDKIARLAFEQVVSFQKVRKEFKAK